jgi:hypothetical protein
MQAEAGVDADAEKIAMAKKREEILKKVEEARKLQEAGVALEPKEDKLKQAQDANIFVPFSGKVSWRPEQAVEWEAELTDFQKATTCASCGSEKITRYLRGRPYMPYVEWHQQKSVELGYTTLTMAGCDAADGGIPTGGMQCSVCKKDPTAAK